MGPSPNEVINELTIFLVFGSETAERSYDDSSVFGYGSIVYGDTGLGGFSYCGISDSPAYLGETISSVQVSVVPKKVVFPL